MRAVVPKILVLGGAVAALLVTGAIWAGVRTLSPPVDIPPPVEVPPPDLPLANRPAALEVLPEEGAAACLAGLRRALAAGAGPAAATYLDRQAEGGLGEMGRQLRAGEEVERIAAFWRPARLEALQEVGDECRGLLRAGPGARRPFAVAFRWNENKRWVIRRLHARPTVVEGGSHEADH